MITPRRASTAVRRRVAAALVACACFASVRAAPQRVASLNLCTDSMLLEIAPATTIVSVTQVSRDPAMSPLHARARRVPHANHGLVEELVPLAPDLVLTGPTTPAATRALLTRLGYQVAHFDSLASLAAYRTALRRLGRRLDRAQQAHELLARLDARIAAAVGKLHRRDSALLIGANGYVPGPDALADDLLAAAGLDNHAARVGLADGGFLSLEALMFVRPDWLLLGTVEGTQPALAGEFLRHPALRDARVARRGLIELPESYWNCGGEFFGEALARLAGATAPP